LRELGGDIGSPPPRAALGNCDPASDKEHTMDQDKTQKTNEDAATPDNGKPDPGELNPEQLDQVTGGIIIIGGRKEP
jgi:hypothetical protein